MTWSTSGVVLVVDDDPSMRQAIERLLDAAGLRSASYASAEALLAAGPGVSAACVVSDFKLPGMSGLDLVRELRARGGWPEVVMITAHDAPALREEARRRGAAAWLAKPFEGKALLAAIDNVAGHGAAPSPQICVTPTKE